MSQKLCFVCPRCRAEHESMALCGEGETVASLLHTVDQLLRGWLLAQCGHCRATFPLSDWPRCLKVEGPEETP